MLSFYKTACECRLSSLKYRQLSIFQSDYMPLDFRKQLIDSNAKARTQLTLSNRQNVYKVHNAFPFLIKIVLNSFFFVSRKWCLGRQSSHTILFKFVPKVWNNIWKGRKVNLKTLIPQYFRCIYLIFVIISIQRFS